MTLEFGEPRSSAGRGLAGDTDARRDPLDRSIDVVKLLRARWRLFRNVWLASSAAILAFVCLLPSTYSGSAVVMLDQRKNNVTDQSSVLSDIPTDPAAVQNQIQLLTSRDLAARVIDKLGLANDPEFGSMPLLDAGNWFGTQPGEPSQDEPNRRRDVAVNAFLRHLTVSPVGLSTAITVTFSSRDRDKAALIANSVVDGYIDAEAAIKFDVTQRTTAWLLDRIRELGQQVQSAEAAVQRYKAENDLTDTANGTSLVDQQLAAVNAQLVSARADLAAKEAESARIESLLRDGRAADVSEVVSSALIVQLRETEADVIRQEAQLSTRYGPLHPKMVAAESQKRDLDAKIEQEVQRIAGSVRNEVAVAKAQTQSLELSLQRLEHDAMNDNMARVKLKSLEANAVSTRSMYEAFVSRLREIQGQAALQMPDARIISHAAVPLAPSWPPRILLASGSVPMGLLFGLLAALVAERLNLPAENRDKESGNRRVALPVVARISGLRSPRAAEAVADDPASEYAQNMRAIVHRLKALGTQAPRIVAMTSIFAGESQTAFSIGIARSAALLGLRVILVDGKIRPAGLDPAQDRPAGLVDVLSGSAPLSQSLRKDSRTNALFLSVGKRAADPAAVWGSATTERLTVHLRRTCDLVLLDGPSFSTGDEWPLFVRLADALIVVTGDEPDACRPVAEALERLPVPPPTGLVLAC